MQLFWALLLLGCAASTPIPRRSQQCVCAAAGYDPVCARGQRFSSRCLAECVVPSEEVQSCGSKQGGTCGGWLGGTCEAGLECVNTAGAMIADAPGRCLAPCGPGAERRDAWGNCIPSSCVHWFDGCNECSLDPDGTNPAQCTERYCAEAGEARCRDGDTAVPGRVRPGGWCEASPPQLCRRLCEQQPSCDASHCAMRAGSCCDYTCVPAVNCCGGGAACGYVHCPAVGSGKEGCVRPWAMPDGYDFDADCTAAAGQQH